nr:ALI_HP1_G0023500.mRNA.1.CDS.1 [Saccharomyces cerevisiae]
MSGYFSHLSSSARFANIQTDQGFIGDTTGTSSDHGGSGMVDFALQLELSLRKIIQSSTLFQTRTWTCCKRRRRRVSTSLQQDRASSRLVNA